MPTYDEIYAEAWLAAIAECERKLDPVDYGRALQVKSVQDFRNELVGLTYADDKPKKAISLIYPTLDHYEAFAQNFVNMMADPVDTSMMWGLLFLVFEVALGSCCDSQVTPLDRIIKWLGNIGYQLKASNMCREIIADVKQVKDDTVKVNKEIIILWLNIIMTFRNEGRGGDLHLEESAWETLTIIVNNACQNIEDAIRRIKDVAEMTERQARDMDRKMYHRLLSLHISKQDNVTLPCHTLPVAENRRFFGRREILKDLEKHLTPADTSSHLSSIALYGLGGIGKTQIALAYAYHKQEDLDAIFWISAADQYSIQQDFSKVAVEALKLEEAQPQAHQKNMILVLNWLQRTSAKWLLVFDNVDSYGILDQCWPTSKHGAILITTRDILVATLPIDQGLEVNEFNIDEGAGFLLHMATKRRQVNGELENSRQVASKLGGLPLALNQMAAVINAKNYSIKDFDTMYSKHEKRFHKERKSGWKYLGYQHSLNTVWDISFTSLGDEARACLGVLSFFCPDSVPSDVFKVNRPSELPALLSFCEDELCLDDALEELTHHALVRKNIERDSFRIHRLVQTEYRSRMVNPQEEFDAATKLLLEIFHPNVQTNMVMRNGFSKPDPLRPTLDFVNLLTNSANAIHDNDTTNSVPGLLETADAAFKTCPKEYQDRLLWAFIQSLKCMYHLCTSEFVRSEMEMAEGLEIRLELLPPDDLLLALACSWLGMALGGQERYDEGLDLLLKAGKILEGPAGGIPTRRLVWGYNTSRNYYCMGLYHEAEVLLDAALKDAESLQSWYMQVYGHLTFASLRTRMLRLDDAKAHVEKAKHLLETSGTAARFSWLGSYCAYRAGEVAMKQNRNEQAIEETEKATAIGKLVKVPLAILCRCVHAYSKALLTDPSRKQEAEFQRLEARRLRKQIPGGGGNLDDESDEAFERLVKMDHR
ncbi:NB-ARC and TPR domain protein [Fusarium austroafricanum]|uniref:NB-ARC and TPR domain protein n=1 Tax=Fusarium austroafricanum TaxID=2364996 RepID=A0A8H4PEZ6_9HYPO|nr:NB-ARC and TPR domain protein [Fusarium austroafricanum]